MANRLDILELGDANPDVTVSDDEDADAINDDVALEAIAARNAPKPTQPNTVPVAAPANGPAPSYTDPFGAKDAMLREALDELRDSRLALVALKAQPEERQMIVIQPIPTPISVAFPEAMILKQDAPPSNVYVTNQVNPTPVEVRVTNDVQPAPVQVSVAPTPVQLGDTIVNVPDQPPAVVNVDVPRITAEHTKVERDADANITGTDKTFTYEGE